MVYPIVRIHYRLTRFPSFLFLLRRASPLPATPFLLCCIMTAAAACQTTGQALCLAEATSSLAPQLSWPPPLLSGRRCCLLCRGPSPAPWPLADRSSSLAGRPAPSPLPQPAEFGPSPHGLPLPPFASLLAAHEQYRDFYCNDLIQR